MQLNCEALTCSASLVEVVIGTAALRKPVLDGEDIAESELSSVLYLVERNFQRGWALNEHHQLAKERECLPFSGVP